MNITSFTPEQVQQLVETLLAHNKMLLKKAEIYHDLWMKRLEEGIAEEDKVEEPKPVVKRGRPLGSKNKTKKGIKK